MSTDQDAAERATHMDFKLPKTMVSPAIEQKVLEGEPDLSTIAGKNILITGGSFAFNSSYGHRLTCTGAGGLGRAMAVKFLAAGANVTIGDLDVKAGEAFARTTRALEFRKCNVLSWEEQLALFQYAFDRRGGIDIVVANAGVTERGFAFTDDLDKPALMTLNINLQAQFYTAKLAHYFLRRNPEGYGRDRALLLVGSMASVGEIPGAPEYTASKHGMLGLMRSIRRTAPADGIRVNSIHPWFVETGIIDEGVKMLLAGTKYADINDVVTAIMILSTNSHNGRALAIMADDLRIVDLFPTNEASGDFQVFMERVANGFALRSRTVTRINYYKDLVKHSTHMIWRTCKLPILAFLLTILYKKRRSPWIQIKMMQLVQKYHELKGTQYITSQPRNAL